MYVHINTCCWLFVLVFIHVYVIFLHVEVHVSVHTFIFFNFLLNSFFHAQMENFMYLTLQFHCKLSNVIICFSINCMFAKILVNIKCD